MRKITYLMLLFFISNSGFTQVKLAELTFETPEGYTTNILEFTDYIPGPGDGATDGRDYFIRTDGSNTRAEIFTNKQGLYYFAAQDIDGQGATLPVQLNIENINISGYSNLEFRVHLAEDDATDGNENWDNTSINNDYVHINYAIDNSTTFENLLWVEASGTGLNKAPSIDTDFNGTGDGIVITNAFTQFTQSIAATGSLLDIQIIFNLDAEEEDIAIDAIEIWGTLVPCASTVTWNGSLPWVDGTPNITTTVELNADYDTATYGSFSACGLNVNAGTLTIGNNNYVEVQNDVTINGNIVVKPYGAFVQKNNFSSVDGDVVATRDKIKVEKLTSLSNRWYEYTYWSSPVLGESINNGLNESQADRRFLFNAQKFLDAKKEKGNNNDRLLGQDDIDDNGDDWTLVNGETPMISGVGYASTHDKALFEISSDFNKQFIYTFEGPFNNGIIKVSIYRNDSETADYNWNFIGNPYPSAIDADLFLEVNSNVANDISDNKGNVDGAIFLWSQNTLPSENVNGNEQLNFSNDDYAIINAMGETMGGDGVKPNRYIPSGQGFFVSMSNTAPATRMSGDIYTTNIVFDNGMRVKGTSDNSQFFKSSDFKKKSNNSPNKLWLNLTSDNGVFNQILVGYVNGATNNDDGISFDTNKYPTKGAALYSTIEGSSKKFAIQGKSVHSLAKEEVIHLGFLTTINVPTLYTLSIADFQGDFLIENSIFLKDNLLNKLHNVSIGDYTFISEVGEFNNRFEIVFNDDALSTDALVSNEKLLSIVELENDHVQFNVSNNLKIKSVSIFDLLGRQLYYFTGENITETYTLSNLKSSVYIAKVTLSNGTVITKKAIKK